MALRARAFIQQPPRLTAIAALTIATAAATHQCCTPIHSSPSTLSPIGAPSDSKRALAAIGCSVYASAFGSPIFGSRCATLTCSLALSLPAYLSGCYHCLRQYLLRLPSGTYGCGELSLAPLIGHGCSPACSSAANIAANAFAYVACYTRHALFVPPILTDHAVTPPPLPHPFYTSWTTPQLPNCSPCTMPTDARKQSLSMHVCSFTAG